MHFKKTIVSLGLVVALVPSFAFAGAYGLNISYRNATDDGDATSTVNPFAIDDGANSMSILEGYGTEAAYRSYNIGSGIAVNRSSKNIYVTPNTIETPEGYLTDTLATFAKTASISGLSGTVATYAALTSTINANLYGTTTNMRVGSGTGTTTVIAGLLETSKWNAEIATMASATSSIASLQTSLGVATSTLAGKFNTPSGTTSQYLRGDGTLATFPGINAGTVTSIVAGTGLSGGTITATGTISLPNTGTAGTYGRVTTDAQGRVTAGKRMETYSGTTDGSGSYTVTFGTSYSAAPNIQANIIGATDTQTSRITNISTTGFTVLVRNRTDTLGLLPSYSNVSGASVDVLITEK